MQAYQRNLELRVSVTLLHEIKNNRSFKSSEHINEKWDGPYRGFGYLSLFSDPIDLATYGVKENY